MSNKQFNFTYFVNCLFRLQKKFGRFSYSESQDKLVIHLEDEKARKNEKAITAAVSKVSQLLYNHKDVSVIVSTETLGAATLRSSFK